MTDVNAHIVEYYVRLTMDEAKGLEEAAARQSMKPRDLLETIVRAYLDLQSEDSKSDSV